MAREIRNWLLQQMKADDPLDGISVVVKLAVTEFGTSRVAEELRWLADYLDSHGEVPGWGFPRNQA